MLARWIVPVLVLPGTVLATIPLLLHFLTRSTRYGLVAPDFRSWVCWGGIFVSLPGFALALWASLLFFRRGEGTAAPWDPPRKLVIEGPYRHVRNPMLTGVILLLVAEALFFQSWALGGWALLFALGNAIYFPLSEEPGLRRRFGEDYRTYSENVGRWIPRLSPWSPPES